MSSQNRFLLPQSTNANTSSNTTASSLRGSEHSTSISSGNNNNNDLSITTTSTSLSLTSNPEFSEQDVGQFSVDTDFDSYWEEEARNPHRNRIRIGRQYQATVTPLLKVGEKDKRKLEDLETLSFCPKKSARVSDAELDHYFTVAKSLNLFASLVETRSLLGRDVTIADLNHIRHKEGLSLASVIQPVRQPTTTTQASTTSPSVSPLSSQQSINIQSTNMSVNQQSPQKSPQTNCDRPSSTSSNSSKDQTCPFGNHTLNQPLMKALSHFINLHHPCHHDQDCKKMLKEIPMEGDSVPTVSITAGNLRQGSSSSFKEAKPGRSRSSLKQAVSASLNKQQDEPEKDNNQSEQQQQQASGENIESPSYEDWTREEVELFSKAIEVCGKNFGSIKKEFLPSKSVKSIVEYYYIGSRDVSESKKKSAQNVEAGDGCSSSEKSQANNNGQGGGGGGSFAGGKSSANSNITGASNPMTTSSNRTTNSNNDTNSPNKTLSDATEEGKQTTTKHDLTSFSKSAASKNPKSEMQDTNGIRSKAKNVDPRMSVYNFDEEFKEDSPVRFDCPKPGTEVKPLKAKPIIPNASLDSEASNSNVGSLKFFMDGQLVLKLNACQDQQEGNEKCHWVQSGDKVINPSGKQKRYTKKAEKSLDSNQNGSKSNSVVSSYQDDDSTKNDDLTGDEDSKESMNSFTNLPQNKSNHSSPNQKRLKVKSEPNMQQSQLPSPINYNRLAVNNRIKERNDNLNSQSPVINQAMPWLQANHLAVAAALLGQLPFPPTTGNMMDNSSQNNVSSNVNMATKPMDLSLEHGSPKSIQKSTSRSRGRSRNN